MRTAAGWLQMAGLGALSQFERDRLRERIIAAQIQRKRLCAFLKYRDVLGTFA